MKKPVLIKQLPNLLTGLNLFIGCLGISFALSGNLHLAALCILISALFDYFDGLAAKLLNAHSAFGKEFDSLADIVSFGVLPAIIIFVYMTGTFCPTCPGTMGWLSYLAYLVTLFSAIRLAKFNTDSHQTDHFLGLPTPANAILISSIPLILQYGETTHFLFKMAFSLANNYKALLIFTVICSVMLVVPLRMLSLKFKTYDLTNNLFKYMIILFAIFTLLIYNIMAIPLIIIFYIFLSVLNMIFKSSIRE